MKLRLAADLQKDSIVDGEGIRTVIWTQGCPHHCKGCHNPTTWSFDHGFEVDIETIKKQLDQLEGQDGITLSGGDPVFQSDACFEIAKYAKQIGLTVWCYTGYLFEDMLKNLKHRKLLEVIDVLVDGKFLIEERSLDLYFKGSRNQRIIDVPASLEENSIHLVEKYAKEKQFKSPSTKSEQIYI